MELTLRSGEKINNSLSVAAIEAAIRIIDSAVVSRGNKKDKLALLKNMVVEELEYSGIWGALPDWRQIQKLPEDILCAEITKLGGTPCEGRRFLCNQLENLNRTLNLGLSERFAQGCLDPLPWERVVPTDQELAQQVQQAEAAVRATEASPDLEENMGSPFSPGLQPLATMPGVSPSPAVGTTQLGLGSYTQASTSTELSASAALTLEPSQLALEGSSYPFLSSNPQVRINPEAALAVAGSNLRDCVDFQDGVLLQSPFYSSFWWRAFEREICAGSSIRLPAHGGSAQPCSRRYCPEAPSGLSSAHLVRLYETHS